MFETTYILCGYKGKATFLSDSLMFLKGSSFHVIFPGSVMHSPKKAYWSCRLHFWAHSLSCTWKLSVGNSAEALDILTFVAVICISDWLILRHYMETGQNYVFP
jgi:hypothetical protein